MSALRIEAVEMTTHSLMIEGKDQQRTSLHVSQADFTVT